MNKESRFGLVMIFATGLSVAGLILGLAFDRPGSVELLFAGLALFLLYDIVGHRASAYFQKHRKAFQLMGASFSLGFVILLLVAALELAFYTNNQLFWEETLVAEATGGALLTLGIGPYISWIVKSRR